MIRRGNKEYLCAQFTINLADYDSNSEVRTLPVTKRNVNNFCGREKYFRKCMKEAYGIHIRIADDGYYVFQDYEEISKFMMLLYLFFLVRDSDGFKYKTEKGVIEYDK
jgi:hypothetical protein